MAALHKNRSTVIFLIGVLASAPTLAAELTIQIGAFGDRPNPAFAEQAAEYGELLVLRGDDGITRVSIGRYDSRTAAREALQRLQIAGYTDAYIANLRGRGSEVATPAPVLPAAPTVQVPQTASGPAPSTPAPRTVTPPPAPTTTTTPAAPTRRVATTPEGRPIVTPKKPAESTVTQAGRFRLRTHDTQSGKTSDVQLAERNPPITVGSQARGNVARERRGAPVVAGAGVNDIPQHLREKLVYLDGVPHIKEGDRFIPLNDAVDGK